MDAGTVGEAGIKHRVTLIDLTSHGLSEVIDGRTKRVFAEKTRPRRLDLPFSFDKNLVVSVDHDFGDRGIVQKLANWGQKISKAGFKYRLS